LIKGIVRFIPAEHYHNQGESVALLHISCLLYKLEVIEHPVMIGRMNTELVVRLATDYLAGHMHIFEDDGF